MPIITMEAIFRRRSIRKYKSISVESEKIEKLLKAAMQHLLQVTSSLGNF